MLAQASTARSLDLRDPRTTNKLSFGDGSVSPMRVPRLHVLVLVDDLYHCGAYNNNGSTRMLELAIHPVGNLCE
jgi:hypothetical protein